MARIAMRIGLVLAAAAGAAVGGTVLVFLFGIIKGTLSAGGEFSFDSAVIFGVGWFGAVGALCGALMGHEIVTKGGGKSSRGAETLTWTLAGIVALFCLSIVFRS